MELRSACTEQTPSVLHNLQMLSEHRDSLSLHLNSREEVVPFIAEIYPLSNFTRCHAQHRQGPP